MYLNTWLPLGGTVCVWRVEGIMGRLGNGSLQEEAHYCVWLLRVNYLTCFLFLLFASYVQMNVISPLLAQWTPSLPLER